MDWMVSLPKYIEVINPSTQNVNLFGNMVDADVIR